MTLRIAWAFFSFCSRSLPNTLTEFSPFTPETASSTLSLIICEKLKPTPGKVSCSSLESSSVRLSLVTPRGHSSKGASGAKSSMFWKPATSVPSSGPTELRDDRQHLLVLARLLVARRPPSGQPRRMARIWPTYLDDCSSEMEMGSVARIQKLPSSSLRHELAAEEAEREHPDEDGDERDDQRAPGRAQRHGEERAVDAVERPHHDGLLLLVLRGDELAREHRRQRERQHDGAADRERVRHRHRREDDAGDARHREERQERDADDERRERHRAGHLARRLEDAVGHGALPVRPQVPEDVLHHDDGRVDDDAEVDRPQRDEVRRRARSRPCRRTRPAARAGC